MIGHAAVRMLYQKKTLIMGPLRFELRIFAV